MWRYGAGLVIVLAAFAFLASIPGGFLWAAITWLMGLPFYGWGWALCTACVGATFLPGIAERVAQEVVRNPPPLPRDLDRKQRVQGSSNQSGEGEDTVKRVILAAAAPAPIRAISSKSRPPRIGQECQLSTHGGPEVTLILSDEN